MGRASSDIPDGMRAVHGRFARWRNSHTGRLPIPEPLWAAAAEVAKEHGVFRTAKVLSLEYGKLKRLTTESQTSGRPFQSFSQLTKRILSSARYTNPAIRRTTNSP